MIIMVIMYECKAVKAKPPHKSIIEVYEAVGGKKKKVEWLGPADKEILEFYGFDVVEESHNGFDKYVVKKRDFRFA